jgi:hypothetical protein
LMLTRLGTRPWRARGFGPTSRCSHQAWAGEPGLARRERSGWVGQAQSCLSVLTWIHGTGAATLAWLTWVCQGCSMQWVQYLLPCALQLDVDLPTALYVCLLCSVLTESGLYSHVDTLLHLLFLDHPAF